MRLIEFLDKPAATLIVDEGRVGQRDRARRSVQQSRLDAIFEFGNGLRNRASRHTERFRCLAEAPVLRSRNKGSQHLELVHQHLAAKSQMAARVIARSLAIWSLLAKAAGRTPNPSIVERTL